jgi:hypothetical protein
MLKMVSRSRQDNLYCKPEMSLLDRTAINVSAFYKHKTIEIRLHQSSTDFYKISNWVDFLYRMSRANKNSPVKNIAQLKRRLGKNHKRLSGYAKKRIKAMQERKSARQKRIKQREIEGAA